MAINQHHRHPHLLLVTIAAQGQINPARHLARRLARTTGARVTLAIPTSSHRRMFPTSSASIADEGGLVSYAAYSDGMDQGFHPGTDDGAHFMSQLRLVGSRTLTCLARSLAGHGHPVTCVVYTILLAWAADVARDLGIPSVLYWIQPAAVFSIYYHFFNGYADVISAHREDPSFALDLPGLPPLQIKDLPSMITDPCSPYLDSYGDIMKALERERQERQGRRPRVLINTFHALEADAIEAIHDLNLISVGPIIENDGGIGKDPFDQDASRYLEWLDTKEEGSVVYISFGSLSRFSKAQVDEISRGLMESGRPYLWVVREYRDDRDGNGDGMVVGWCDQVRVLSHRSVGCFVTHCGWNSMLESVASGVPMVMVPQWADQATNARLAEGAWGVGVRAGVNGQGVMEAAEMRRCLDAAIGDGDRRVLGMRKKAEFWRGKAREAVGGRARDDDVGPSVRNLVKFVDEIESEPVSR